MMITRNSNLSSAPVFSIFISYRRDDTSGHAGHLYALLSNKFPGQVFMDIDKIEPGQDFVEAINNAIDKSKVLIVLIGREWLSITNSSGHRRLDNPDDPVRVEIASALKRNILVIPVLVEGAGMPQQKDLPEALAGLARLNAIELSDARWNHDVERLVKILEAKFPDIKSRPETGLVPETRLVNKKRILIASIIASLIVLGVIGFFRLLPAPKPDGSSNTSDISTQPQLQALVNMSEAEATFVFPSDTNRNWRWNLKESNVKEREYRWQVEIENGDMKYFISAYNYKNEGMEQKEGKLERLMADTGQEVTYLDNKTKVWGQIKDAVIGKTVSQGKISIVVKGEGVKRVFSNKPKEAKFVSNILNDADEKIVRIDYKD